MFEQTFRNIDDILYKDSGADSELDYIGQTNWVMFLRYLDALENDKRDDAELQATYRRNIVDLAPTLYAKEIARLAIDRPERTLYSWTEYQVCSTIGIKNTLTRYILFIFVADRKTV